MTRIVWLAIGLYGALSVLQIAQKPGMQYDEALFAVGTVHMRHLPHQEVTLPHDPDTWIRISHRWFPLMSARYVGAIKEYLFLPVFAMFGPRTSLVRLVSMLLGAIGIWGMAKLVRGQAGIAMAACFALLLAINPSYVDFTVFDNDAVAISMATLGVLCVAISRYVARRTMGAAFMVGIATGLMIWARANLVWVAAAIFGALFIGAIKHLPRVSHWAVAVLGGIAGGAPFLAYQIISHGGTWQALGMFSTQQSLSYRLVIRAVMFSETLLIDREHRAMWDGPAMASWQPWLFSAVVIASLVVCLASREVFARAAAVAFLLLAAMLFLTAERVSEHHLVALLPFAVAMAALAGAAAIRRVPSSRYGIAAIAAIYIGCAFYWQGAAIRGLHQTGGIGTWSDGVVRLGQYLEEKYPGREIQILDWGFTYNLYVITDGRLHLREIFPDATREQSGLGRPWMDEVGAGGIFVLNAPNHRQIPAASEGFLAAFEDGRPAAQRTTIAQREGSPYAEVIEVDPNTTHSSRILSSFRTADAAFSSHLEGFYEIEEGAFRWTKRQFAILLDLTQRPEGGPVRLGLEIYLPDSLIEKLGTVTISARLGDHRLEPQTFRSAGSFTYTRELPAAWLAAGSNRIEFSLDKSLPPTATDGRALGIIVVRASLRQVE